MNGRRYTAGLTSLAAIALIAGMAWLTSQNSLACPKECTTSTQKASAAATPANSAGSATPATSSATTATAVNASTPAIGCCAKDAKAIKANASSTCSATSGAKVMKANATAAGKSCTREECIAKLMAQGMTKDQAEAKYEACLATGKCDAAMMKTCSAASPDSKTATAKDSKSTGTLVQATATQDKPESK